MLTIRLALYILYYSNYGIEYTVPALLLLTTTAASSEDSGSTIQNASSEPRLGSSHKQCMREMLGSRS